MKKSYIIISKLLLMFFLASLIGWLYEIGCMYALFQVYADRGVLHLPCCPIYGFGLLLLYGIFHKVKNPIVIFAGSALITTAVEYLTYEFVWYRYHVMLWTYEGWPLNYQGKISAVSSAIFGLMAVLFLKLAVPPINRLFESKAGKAAAVFVAVLYVFCFAWEITRRLA